MKTKRLNVRISERRSDKLRLYAVLRDKTLTQIVDDWIDSISDAELEEAKKLIEKLSS